MSPAESTYFPHDAHQLADVADFLQAYRDKIGKKAAPQHFLPGPTTTTTSRSRRSCIRS